MILKMTNKSEGFYSYMGKFFGSRIVQTETKDRIYDDNNKVWYVYVDKNSKVYSFVSVVNQVIKNVYSTNNSYLADVLFAVKKDIVVQTSIVTKIYEEVYLNCGFKINNLDNYKHFIMIRGDEE